MQPIKCEWFLDQTGRRISSAHDGYKLICFDHDALGNGKYSRQDVAAHRYAAGAEKTHHLPEKSAVFNGIESDLLRALQNRSLHISVIGIEFVNAVSDDPNMWPGA